MPQSVGPEGRYERKFVAGSFDRYDIEILVRSHPACFRVAYPARVINNIYLDTPAKDRYWGHVSGSERRAKLRIRWYGTGNGRVNRPVLEVKTKHGLVGWKQRYRLPSIESSSLFDVASFLPEVVADAVPPALWLQLMAASPSLYNRYLRAYFVSADGHFRVTVDDQLAFRAMRCVHGRPFQVPSVGTPVVIELKYKPEHDEAASAIANRFPFRIAQLSKYCLGIDSLAGLGT